MAKREVKTTPVGIAVYPRLNEPDTKFDPDGEYSLGLRLTPGDPGVDEFLEWLDERAEQGVEELREQADKPAHKRKLALEYQPYSYEEDDEGEPTGNVLVRFKSKSQFKSKKTGKVVQIKPKLFDAKGKLLPDNVNVGGGSEVKVAFHPRATVFQNTKAALQRQLEAVQVIELVEWGSASAESYGFGEEDGYEVDESSFPTDTSDDADVDDAEDEDEDDF